MKSSTVAYFDSLPEEIIEKILSNVEDKKNCYLVSRRFNELCLNLDQDKFCVNFKYLCVFNKVRFKVKFPTKVSLLKEF